MTDRSALTLQPLAGDFCVCRLPAGAALPKWLADPSAADFYCLVRTGDETSVLLAQTSRSFADDAASELKIDRDWSGFALEGPFDFGQVGILVQLLEPLRDAGVGMLAVSSFDTDFLFVKRDNRARAVECLAAAGVRFAG
jgi:hypothetical protein